MSDSPDIAAGRMTSKTIDDEESVGLDNNVEGSDLADASDLGGSVIVEPSHRGSVDLNNSEAIIVEEESQAAANEETADVKEEESTTISPDSVIPPTPETDGVAAHVMNKFYVPKSKKGTNRRASDESSPSLEQAMKNELESSSAVGGNDIPVKENVLVEEEEAKEETKKEDNQEKRVSWDVDLENGEEVKLPNEIIDEQQQQSQYQQDDQQQQPIFKFNYHPLPHEKEYYEKLCAYAKGHNSSDIINDIVSPGAAAKLFITSGIPSDRLRMIWNMSVLPATPYPPGTVPPPAMTSGQFYASVRLIQLFQNRITAKDEMLRVDEGIEMAPAYFAGVSGVLIPLPDEELPLDFGEGVPAVVVPDDSEAAATPQVSNKKEQNGMVNGGTKEEEPPKKRVSGALRNSTKLRNSVAGEEKMRRNSTINERSHQARRATDPDSVDPKSSVSRSISGALASVVEDNTDKVNTPSENEQAQIQKERDQEYNNKIRRRRSSLGDENEKIIWTRAMKRMSSIGAGSVTATSASDEAMRRQSSAFPPIMSVGAQAIQDESVVAYGGAEIEYFMSQGEYLTYQGTFSRHCVTEVVGDHAEQYVYVEAALALFEKSGLNRDTIGKLWDVVVLNPDAGKLNEIEFVLLTHLIVCCTRRNLKEPSVLPVPLRLWRENQINPGHTKEEEVKQNDTMPLRVEVEASGEEASYVPTNTAMPTSRVEVEASEEVSYVPPPTNIPTRNTVDIEPSEEVSHVSPNTGVTYQYKSKTSSNSNKSLSSEDHRYKRMEREIRSLATLVGSLTTEIHDLKGMMQQKTSPTSVTRMTSHQQHNGTKNGVKRTSRGRAAPQAAISVPARKPKPYELDEDAPNEEVEMYWGDKNDDTNELDRSERSAKSNVSTKKWKCDVGCDAVFDDYNICLAHERTCQGNRPRPISPPGDTDQYSQSVAPPKRLTASERLRISREKKEETKRNLRLSRNVPSFHPSSLPSSSAPRSQMNRSMPQSRVDMARDAGNGVARSMMMNGAPQQHQKSTTRESMMRNLRQGNNNASFRPAKLQPISKKNRQPGLEDISEKSSEQEHSPVPGILKGGKNYLDISERSATSRTSYSRSMPVNNTSPSSSGMPPRPQQMNRSMPNPGASQTMSEIEHRRLLAEQFKAPQQTEPGNLASQMQQVQREEQFDNLMQTTLNRFGSDSVNGSITSGSAAPSLNRVPNRHQHQNDLNSSFKPVQLNRRQLRQQKSLGASVRHVYRRKSGTTEAYKTTARKSTMALDLPPLS